MSQVAKEHEVPVSTLKDKMANKHPLNHGRPCALSPSEEIAIAEHLKLAGSWGFPLRSNDLCLIIQLYLNDSGRKCTFFKNNEPSREWVQLFLQRHEDLSVRLSENIKRSRAKVNDVMINEYFDNLEVSLNGIPPSNILNYDETNFTDDPGSIQVIVKRGSKHPERIIDSSKSATVYKAKHLYPTWIEGGIPGSWYNRNSSGWFDMDIFEDWFLKICLPYLKNLPGKKVMIGDNLASHVSPKVIKECQENDIAFILLPPNSTHLSQPLDVAIFRSIKKS
ncbi:uncharacterized protein LOC127283805 [Leptopilina boulardi]|uniref:uncharacterized protein LOC127283805 n=1 Tax=Leptopilina boulardi TaxID=63433 RepID=UPI0021F52128|nr:uncharacterized protein LOC127283805 [Leptopilina boulardi]